MLFIQPVVSRYFVNEKTFDETVLRKGMPFPQGKGKQELNLSTNSWAFLLINQGFWKDPSVSTLMMSQLFAMSDQGTIYGDFLWWSFPISFLEKDRIVPWMLNSELKFCYSVLCFLPRSLWRKRKGGRRNNEVERYWKNNAEYWKLIILNNALRNLIMSLAAIAT